MDSLISRVRTDLLVSADEKTKQVFQRFFKETVTYYGVKTPTVDKIAKKYWREIQHLSKPEIFGLCEELYASGFTEEAFVAAFWLPNMVEKLEPTDLATFKRWIEKYIDNWAKCDGFCNHTIGDFIEKYPEIAGEVKCWAKSDCRWLRRAAAVSFIVPAKKASSSKMPSKSATCCSQTATIWCRRVTVGCLRRKAGNTRKRFLITWCGTIALCRERRSDTR
jgi:3-methyladenine DNA glycosylase AlkD